jgi:hypothetical protein
MEVVGGQEATGEPAAQLVGVVASISTDCGVKAQVA